MKATHQLEMILKQIAADTPKTPKDIPQTAREMARVHARVLEGLKLVEQLADEIKRIKELVNSIDSP